jgi:hypothetical protein
VPTGFWAMLWRVAWLSILLGLLVQLALVLADIRLGRFAEARPLAGATARTVGWSVLVCTGIALGRAASKVRTPLMGVTGLLAAPVALNVANMLQRAIHEALDVANISPGVVPLWLMLIKAAEYGFLGAALGWIGRRAWAGALEHVGIGLITALFFGGVTLFLKVQAAPKPLRDFVGQGINELLFPVGCALVIYAADVLGRQVRADEPRTSQQPLTVVVASTGERYPFPFRLGASSRQITLTVGPSCDLNLGHWVCVTHRRAFATRHRRARHTRHSQHLLVWMCWAHGPEQPGTDQLSALEQDGLADPEAPSRAPSQPATTDLSVATGPRRPGESRPVVGKPPRSSDRPGC